MMPIKIFKIGSQVFFSRFPEYKQKDDDELYIMDSLMADVLNARFDGKDIFMYRNKPKEWFISDCLESGVPMRAGKFLIPDFLDYLGAGIEDILRLDPCFQEIDEKHTYEKIIYSSYIQNGGFYLTPKQLLMAWEEYKRTRPEIYHYGEN